MMVALLCQTVFASGGHILHGTELGAQVSLLYCIPFVGMLLSIAICPLVIPHQWEKWRWAFVLFWSVLFLVPFAMAFGAPTMLDQLLHSMIGDYLTFIVLLFGLFCVAGNICLEGDLAGTPKTNLILLLIGTLLASWIGTTGASMVMIRPLLRANQWRSRCVHTVVFFIFLVSNIGGSLTPIGDPPLLMGFMRGVPFQWTLIHMLPVMALNVVLLLILYYIMDSRAYKKDLAAGRKPLTGGAKIKLTGAHNILFMLMIVAAVVLSGVLPKLPMFQDAAGNVLSLQCQPDVYQHYRNCSDPGGSVAVFQDHQKRSTHEEQLYLGGHRRGGGIVHRHLHYHDPCAAVPQCPRCFPGPGSALADVLDHWRAVLFLG